MRTTGPAPRTHWTAGGYLAAVGDDYDSGDDDETSGKFGSNGDFAEPKPGDEYGDRWHEVEQRRRRGDGQVRRGAQLH